MIKDKSKMKDKVRKILGTALVSLFMVFVSGSAIAQTGSDCAGKFGTDSIMDRKNISMFNQYIQSRDFADAYDYWQYLFNNIPCYTRHITYNGPIIVKYKMKDLKDQNDSIYQVRKEGLIDSVLLCYDYRIRFWGQRGYVLGKWANDLAKLRPTERPAALEMFAESVDLEGNKTDDLVPMYYLDAAIDEHKRDGYTLDSLFQLYFQMRNIIDYNLTNNVKQKNDWVRTDTIVEKMMRAYLTPEALEQFYKPKIEASPKDAQLLMKVQELLIRSGGEKTDFGFDIAVKMYALNPSSSAAISIGKSHFARGETDKAFEYFKKGAADIADPIEKGKIYTAMANIRYKAGSTNEAKALAQQAVEADPNNGSAHYLIAIAYGSSASACTADGIDGRSVFWAAVDRAVKAKTVDPSVTDKANELINRFSAQFVTKEDAFFKNFTAAEGSSFTVPCLGVTTTVRYKK
ncbi:MAG: tetratricopeptide (TPR) repeat protein [Bacteroidia bacterium]|jgi:tetratricopeptide (TPR) repeat protein